MKLIECYIDAFGKFSAYRHVFSPGMNSINEENGYGKTTLTVFIKAMLYGLDPGRKKNIEKSERLHYMPWGKQRAGGRLVFEHDGKRYRIERTFGTKAAEDTFTLYDEKTGRVSEDFSENIGEELFSVDADGFERTVFLSEQNLSGKNENKTVSAKLSSLTGVESDLGNMDEAMKRLDEKRKELHKRSKEGGAIQQAERRIAELVSKINGLDRKREDIASYEARLAKINERLSSLEAEAEKHKILTERAREARHRGEFIQQWNEMKIQLAAEEAKLEELERFFASGIPDDEELAEIHDAEIRIYTIDTFEGASARTSDGIYTSLSEFFSSNVDESQFSALERGSMSIKEKEAEISRLRDELNASEFDTGAEIHTSDEYDRVIGALSRKRTPSILLAVIMLALSAAVCACGLITSVLYAVGGALLLISMFVLIFGMQKSKRARNAAYAAARELLSRDIPESELLNALYEAKAEARAKHTRRVELETLKKRMSELQSELTELMREMCSIIANFPIAPSVDIHDAINEILTKRKTYEIYRETLKGRDAEAAARIAERKMLTDKVTAFAARFGIHPSAPSGIVEKKRADHTQKKAEVALLKKKIDDHAKRYSITAESVSEVSAAVMPATDIAALKESIEICRSDKAVTERMIDEAIEECDSAELLREELAALTEEKERLEQDLATVTGTRDFLERAASAITEKYLSATQAAFKEYISIISAESPDDFKLDTSFVVRKSEGTGFKEAEAYSRGTRDLYALATRLALIDSLYQKETPFIILDDPFVYFDDAHIKAGMNLLSSIAKKKQIIYLTCTKSRRIQ